MAVNHDWIQTPSLHVRNHQKTKSDAKVLRRPQTKTENEHNFCTFSKITRQYLCEDRKIVKKAAKLSTKVCRKQNWLTCRKVVYWKLSPSTVFCPPPPPCTKWPSCCALLWRYNMTKKNIYRGKKNHCNLHLFNPYEFLFFIVNC